MALVPEAHELLCWSSCANRPKPLLDCQPPPKAVAIRPPTPSYRFVRQCLPFGVFMTLYKSLFAGLGLAACIFMVPLAPAVPAGGVAHRISNDVVLACTAG